MKFTRRITLKLKDHTPARFALWKEMESEITNIFKSYGINVFDILYTEITKSVIVAYKDFENYSEAVICVGQFGASKGLFLEQVSVENLETSGSQCNKLIAQYKERKRI